MDHESSKVVTFVVFAVSFIAVVLFLFFLTAASAPDASAGDNAFKVKVLNSVNVERFKDGDVTCYVSKAGGSLSKNSSISCVR